MWDGREGETGKEERRSGSGYSGIPRKIVIVPDGSGEVAREVAALEAVLESNTFVN